MSNPMQKMESMLSAGQQPSYADLEEVLAQCLTERNAFESIAIDMGNWLSSLVTAHIEKDAVAIKDILDAFIKTNVKIVPKASKEIH
ncbi:hypothetical protein [Undibacterium sp. Xuan67W]|uniref:hypothetical protein n=1 Tax=Undibacterium sp. Xuan67W TaxID=3413057 RepID=UPI003BF1C0F1